MKSRWKRIFIWSSLGGAAVGAAVAWAKRAQPRRLSQLETRSIPEDCQRVSLWTEQFKVAEGDLELAVQDKYVLQVTPFRVWNVLELSTGPGEPKGGGSCVFHVTHLRYAENALGQGYPDEGRLQDRFYGTIGMSSLDGKVSVRNQIGRGSHLEIRKCLVGGSSNGIETGEKHVSVAPIMNYRFEYSAR